MALVQAIEAGADEALMLDGRRVVGPGVTRGEKQQDERRRQHLPHQALRLRHFTGGAEPPPWLGEGTGSVHFQESVLR